MCDAPRPAPTDGVPPAASRNPDPDAQAPDGSQIRPLIDESHLAHRASLCEVTLLAGQVSRPVYHRRVEEVWYVLQGRGRVWRCPPGADPARVAPVGVGPGDALAIPPEWTFQFAADGRDLRFLCYTSPPWPGPDEAQPAPWGALGEPTV